MSKIESFVEMFDDMADEQHERIIPIVAEDQDVTDDSVHFPDTMPILPLRNAVMFPGVITPVSVGRKRSLKLIRNAYKKGLAIGTIAQIDEKVETPNQNDLYRVGTVADILKILEMPDGSTTAILQGKRRFVLDDILYSDPYHMGKITLLKESLPDKHDKEYNAIVESVRDSASKLVKLSSTLPPEANFALRNIDNSMFLVNFVANNAGVDFLSRQQLLEIDDAKERASFLLEILGKQISLMKLKNEIQERVRESWISNNANISCISRLRLSRMSWAITLLMRRLRSLRRPRTRKNGLTMCRLVSTKRLLS